MRATWIACGLVLVACSAPSIEREADGVPASRSIPGRPMRVEPAAPREPAAAAVDDGRWVERARLLFTRALEDNGAIAQLRDLLAAAPKRLSGSPGADAAVAWGVQRMRDLGLDAVRAEPVLVPCWVRGAESAAVIGANARPLRVTALGGSVPTPPGGLRAEVVEVRSFEQLRALGEQARGKIAFFNRPMPRIFARTFRAYGDAVPQRSNGAIEAAQVGAVAALVRSVTTAVDEFPHTGAMRYQDGVDRVPAAAIATADAEALSRLLDAGPVTITLELGCETRPDVMSANVTGELRGSELPDEIVVIGAHLDAWDLGTGAHDDGAGCAHVLEAMLLLRACGIAPRRTIRAVLFMNEENGLRGGEAYADAHVHELHVAALETDAGGATPHGLATTFVGADAEALRPLLRPLGDWGAGVLLTGGGGGADIGPLMRRGVPGFGLVTDSQRYFDYHHSALDTIDAVNERELALGAAVVAYTASVLADR
ncbi:MAG: M28 family peptidase [Planctomycetota bacterium]